MESWYCINGHQATGTKFYTITGGYRWMSWNFMLPSFGVVPFDKHGPICRECNEKKEKE